MESRFVLIPLYALLSLAPGGGRAEPTATPMPGLTSSAQAGADTLAFLRDGDIWLIEADGGNGRRLGLNGVLSFAWVSPREIDLVARDDRPKHLLVDSAGSTRELFFPGDFDVSGGLSSVHARGSWSRDGRLFAAPLEGEIGVYDSNGYEVARLDVGAPPATNEPSGFKTDCDLTDQKHETPVPSRPAPVNLVGSPVFTSDARAILVAVYCGAVRQPDGELSFPRNLYSRLYRVPLDGGAAEGLPISTNLRSNSRPLVSPDGSRIAVPTSSWNSVCDSRIGLSVAGADGSTVEWGPFPELEEAYRQGDSGNLGGGILGGIVGFDWSPQGDALVVSVDVSVCRGFGPEPVLAGLYLLKLDGSPAVRLLDGSPAPEPLSGRWGQVAWSPSGQYIAYDGIRLFNLTTGEVTELAHGAQPAWQPMR